MDVGKLLETMHLAERLKDTLRHSWTSAGRQESVAEHSWRMALMACFLRDEFSEADWEKVLMMALLHDMGECFTGDIPAFYKTDAHREEENNVTMKWCGSLPAPYDALTKTLFEEMDALETVESRIVKALDKMEVLIQHNEADLSTWLPLEYEKNLTHGAQYTAFSGYMEELRAAINEDTRQKIRQAQKQNPCE